MSIYLTTARRKKLLSAFEERENRHKVVIHDALMSNVNSETFVLSHVSAVKSESEI